MPGSPVLSDGHAVYTPGLSERRAGVTTFDSFDRLGNLWTVDGTASQYNQTYYQDTTGFGALIGAGGTNASPFKFGGANGCQSDLDTGLVLMGHRYYDPRIGRFLSQDPAGDGNNWYVYAGNSPTNDVDPDGLDAIFGDFGLGGGGVFTNSGSGQPPGNYVYGPDSLQPGVPYTVNPDGSVSVTERGITIPSSSSGLGWGGLADDWLTFSTVQRAGQVAGDYDSGKASRGAAIGAGALAVGAIVAVGATDGEDVEAGAAVKLEGWIAKDVFSTLAKDVGEANLKKFVEALQKGIVGPTGKAGIKVLKGNIGYTHELKIGGSSARLLGNIEDWNGVRTIIFRELSSRGLH